MLELPQGDTTAAGGFAALLRRYRLAAGLSQEALAERARLSVEAISTLERGRRTAPRLQTVRLLAEALALEGSDRAAFLDAARGVPAPPFRPPCPPNKKPKTATCRRKT